MAYRVVFSLHLLAALLWLGHMFFWSVFGGPALKKIQPPETAALLREMSMRLGGLGGPSLAILIATGAYLLAYRGIGPADLVSASFLSARYGRALALKLVLVTGMVVYQFVFGHRRAPRAIYGNMLAALLALGAALVLAGG